MERNFKILIDASGSMGYMNGTNDQNKYLLPDGKSRTDLVKRILNKSIINGLPSKSNVELYTFRNSYHFKKDGTKKIIVKEVKDNTGKKEFKKFYSEYPDLKLLNKGNADEPSLKDSIKKIETPTPGGTPLFWALSVLINKASNRTSIIVLSDGDANDKTQFDTEILNLIEKENKDCTIHFIGISQNSEAKEKSKNLSLKTGGVYVNLKALDYDEQELKFLLSKLNSSIITKAIDENINVNKSVESKEEAQPKGINEDKTVLELQVQKNTQSLEYISTQLTNILSILEAKESIDEEVEINENTLNNNRIGRLAEQFLFKELKLLFKDNKNVTVEWLNEVEEQGFPYDFLIKNNNQEFYYECKGTSSDLNEFLLTKNEWNFYLDNRDKYRLCFVSNVETNPSYTRFMNLLEDISNKKIIPCSSKNRKIKSNRILFQVL